MTLNPTAASLLGFLHRGPLTGWELQSWIERSIGDFWSLTRSQVYRELKTLAGAGLLRAGATGKRDRQPYSITAAGREAFRTWIAQPPASDILRLPLVVSVFFGAHIEPDLLRRYLQTARLEHDAQRARFLTLREHVQDPFQRAALELGIEYETLLGRWAGSLPWAQEAGAPRARDADSNRVGKPRGRSRAAKR
ncbi:MAG: PadR family transcriptional regulator [Polyangiaceae bacterium]